MGHYTSLPVLEMYAEALSMKNKIYVRHLSALSADGTTYYFLTTMLSSCQMEHVRPVQQNTVPPRFVRCARFLTLTMTAAHIQSYHSDPTRYAAVDNLLHRKGPWTDERFQGGTEVCHPCSSSLHGLSYFRQQTFSGQRQKFW